MIAQTSEHRDYPLPHEDNPSAREDIMRIRDALQKIDTDITDGFAASGLTPAQVDIQIAAALVDRVTTGALDLALADRVTVDALNAAIADRVTTDALNAAVTAAVTALVDTAPDALNTLNELAAALGDDANFAATITAQVAAAQATADAAAAAIGDGGISSTQKNLWTKMQRVAIAVYPFAYTLEIDGNLGPYARFGPVTDPVTIGRPINMFTGDAFTLEIIMNASGGNDIFMDSRFKNQPADFVSAPNKRMWMDILCTDGPVDGIGGANELVILGSTIEP